MIWLRSTLLGILTLVALSACANRGVTAIPQRSSAVHLASTSSAVVPNRFSAATSASLKSSDIDNYIDSSVVGEDRTIARKLMKLMPPNQRGDFIYLAPGNRVISNNPDLAKATRLGSGYLAARSAKARPRALRSTSSTSSATRRPQFGASTACSPPDPPSEPKGAYVREISLCGFTAGWGYVRLKSGTSYFPSGDAGHLYFEIKGRAGTLVEGGLEVYSDSSIAPYMRSTTQRDYVRMTNDGVRYFADTQMAIWMGITDDGSYIFTEIGELPPNLSPQQTYLSGYEVHLYNASWTFWPAPSDFHGASSDPAGHYTPCGGCSISKVTSIAQNNVTDWVNDGAYFGVTQDGRNAITWDQVLFGNWSSNCEPGTSLCTIIVSRNPYVYYGGLQWYPDGYVSQSNLAPSGYGPYISYDGIDTTGDSTNAHARNPLGGFADPLPTDPVAASCSDILSWMVSNSKGGDLVYEPIVGTTTVFTNGSQAVYNGSTHSVSNLITEITKWTSTNGAGLTGKDLYNSFNDHDYYSCTNP